MPFYEWKESEMYVIPEKPNPLKDMHGSTNAWSSKAEMEVDDAGQPSAPGCLILLYLDG
jgi:hypothetical protein